MAVLLVSLIVIGLAMLAMAVGVIFRRPCLRGSCGGAEVLGPDGDPLTCATCPRRKDKTESPRSEPSLRTSPLPVLKQR